MGLISRVSSRTYRVFKKKMSTEQMTLRGTLEGHGGWVTQVTTNPKFPDLLLSSSRDKSLIMWKLNKTESQYGFPQKRLTGHNHFVSDVVISSCGQFAVSSSWDKTLRLWDLEHSTCTTKFNGHTADVLSVAFSADNRQIISCGRDKTIKLRNTLGELKWTQDKTNKSSHSEWVSTVKFSPTAQNPVIVSGGWDKQIKVWHLSNFQLKSTFSKHTGYVNSVTVSPDGSLAASGGQDGVAMLWDLSDNASNNPLHTLEAGEEINKLIFSQTGTGFVLLVALPSKSGILNTKLLFKNSPLNLFLKRLVRTLLQLRFFHSAGLPMDKRFSLATPTASSGSSRSQLKATLFKLFLLSL